jgi:MFS family permease
VGRPRHPVERPFIIVLDNTILNVAVPTIIREFDTSVSSLQSVIAGYSLVLASRLVSFGRLRDLIGGLRSARSRSGRGPGGSTPCRSSPWR